MSVGIYFHLFSHGFPSDLYLNCIGFAMGFHWMSFDPFGVYFGSALESKRGHNVIFRDTRCHELPGPKMGNFWHFREALCMDKGLMIIMFEEKLWLSPEI